MADNRTVTATIGKDLYRTEVQTSVHSILSDEPADMGGKDLGPTPGDFLRMSLASCTAITLRMYADRKKWDVEQIRVVVSSEQAKYKTIFRCSISVAGKLDAQQLERLQQIAKLCPVHKVLANPIEVETELPTLT